MCPSQSEVLLPETARDVPQPERSSVASDCQRYARASTRAYVKACVTSRPVWEPEIVPEPGPEPAKEPVKESV
nr:hypothetical protein CFP56_54975 [Quercus suber]